MEIYFNIFYRNGNTFYQTCFYETLSEQEKHYRHRHWARDSHSIVVKIIWEKEKSWKSFWSSERPESTAIRLINIQLPVPRGPVHPRPESPVLLA